MLLVVMINLFCARDWTNIYAKSIRLESGAGEQIPAHDRVLFMALCMIKYSKMIYVPDQTIS